MNCWICAGLRVFPSRLDSMRERKCMRGVAARCGYPTRNWHPTMPTKYSLSLEFLCHDARVVAAEAERVVHHRINLHLPRRIGHIVQIALRIRHLVTDSWRDCVGLNGFGANCHF